MNTTLSTPPFRAEFTSCGDQTTPWLIVVGGAVARHVFNVALFLWAKRSKQKEATVAPAETESFVAGSTSDGDSDNPKAHVVVRVIQELLSAYAVIQFFVQFVRDISYIDSGSDDLSRTWDGYQCTALVIANSPNTKAAWLFIAVINTEGMYDDETGFGAFPRLYKYAMLLAFFIALPFYFTHTIPGMVIYFPFYMPLIGFWAATRGLVETCGARLAKSENAGTALRDGFIYPLLVLLMTACSTLSIIMFQTPTDNWQDVWWDNFKSVADDPQRSFDVWRAHAEESAGNGFSAAYSVL